MCLSFGSIHIFPDDSFFSYSEQDASFDMVSCLIKGSLQAADCGTADVLGLALSALPICPSNRLGKHGFLLSSPSQIGRAAVLFSRVLCLHVKLLPRCNV